MVVNPNLFDDFSRELYKQLSKLKYGVSQLALDEFRYALEYIQPEKSNWSCITVPPQSTIEKMIGDNRFYREIELKPQENCVIHIDKNIIDLNRSLFAGIVNKAYNLSWVDNFFYFDLRSFLFFPKTLYFTKDVLEHLQEKPYLSFKKKQDNFNSYHSIGLNDFISANKEIDYSLINIIDKLCTNREFPIIIAIAGPTAAGKTEFSEFLSDFFKVENKTISNIEMDNFFLDREYRERIGVGSMSKKSIHFEMLKESLLKLKQGKSCNIPKYDFIKALSSHTPDGKLKGEGSTIKIDAADIILVEGNFPFLFHDIIPLMDIKVFYLTDDPIRLKRKWKRDIDYRKKYDPKYLCNRFFRTQFLKAQLCYQAQLGICDIAVDTTQGNIFVSSKIKAILDK